jgi:hypothetical protein
VHIAQAKRYSLLLFYLMYFGPSPFLFPAALALTICDNGWALLLWSATVALLPLSIGLAWGRWKIEREAYLTQLGTSTLDVEAIVTRLHTGYLYPWPRKWMSRWLQRHK